MTDAQPFAQLLGVVAVCALLAILSGGVSRRLRIPSPALFLVGAAAAAELFDLPHLDSTLTERLVTVALLCILFDGGMHIGRRRARAAVGPVLLVGVLGTFLTTVGVAVAAHELMGISWYAAALLGAALAPTDPAVVFNVLGGREVEGRSGTILEGESGANDPVGIALMVSLLTAGSLGSGALGSVAVSFTQQMVIGAVCGLLGGRLLLLLMRRVSLPSEGLYPLRTLGLAVALFAGTTLIDGSGFLAVFLAGIVIGDERAPFKRDVEQFHSSLASLAEIVAFITLGLTVDLDELTKASVWLPAAGIFLLLVFVIRPAAVSLSLLGSGLDRGERLFVLFAGLKGAVPILLGFLVLESETDGASRLYAVTLLVVLASVVLQGGLVPTAARRLGVPMRELPQQPYAFGVRLVDEPEGTLRLKVAVGSPADGATVDSVCDRAEDSHPWVNMVVRDQALVEVRGTTVLHAGDLVILTADKAVHALMRGNFESD